MTQDYLQKYLNDAKSCLEDYTDEIPNKILHNVHSTHKVSSGWFQRIGGIFSLANKRGFINDSYKSRFFGYLDGSGFYERLTTREDIQFAEELLDEFIAELTSK
ncbi:MAG: hypothetical protein V1831_03880 [Candidatus Woesearchaeota archaeon]